MEDFYFCVDSLSTGISNQGELIKREKPFWKEGWEGQKKTRRSFLFFPAWKAHYSSSSPLSEKHPLPLNYFTFFSSRLTSPQAHTVWVFFFYYSTASILSLALLFPRPRRCSLLSFLLPSPLSLLFSLHCWLLTPTSSQPKSSSVPVTLIEL